jgi:hypothetical protein
MEILQESRELTKNTFFNHIFSTSDEGKAEMFNAIQYVSIGFIPIFSLNKLIQRFVPEADLDKSSLELLVEIFIQLIVIFCGIIIIHRFVTYFPTYSGFKYDNLALTNIILGFLVLVLSIQSKLGLKSNIIYERLLDLWEGTTTSDEDKKKQAKKGVRVQHNPSQSDHLDTQGLFPPPVLSTTAPRSVSQQQSQRPVQDEFMQTGPLPSNFSGGSIFGSIF